MANINIYEQDNTLLGGIGENDNIVYIPGFAATNTNVYIITTAGTVPTPATVGITQAEAESLPEDFVCPLCGVGAELFEEKEDEE